MTEIFKVTNNTRGIIQFQVYPIQDREVLNAVASHHRRRAIRSAARTVTIPHAHSVDLVAITGLTIADLEFNVDLNNLIKIGHLQVLELVKAGEVDKVEPADVISEAEVAAEATNKAEAATPLPPSFEVPVAKPVAAKVARKR